MTRSRRRRTSAGPRCPDCRRPVRWFRFRGRWKTFAPRPIAPADQGAVAAYPVEGHQAWLVDALVDELMGRRHVSRGEAREEVYDLDWYPVHVCPHPDDPDHQHDDESQEGTR